MRLIDYRETVKRIVLADVLFILDLAVVTGKGIGTRGPCPNNCCDDIRCTKYNHPAKLYICYRCRDWGGPIDLYASRTGLPKWQACVELCKRLGIEPVYLPRGTFRRPHRRSNRP